MLKTTPTHFVPASPSARLKLFLSPLFCRGKTCPPPIPISQPPLSVINDQSLTVADSPPKPKVPFSIQAHIRSWIMMKHASWISFQVSKGRQCLGCLGCRKRSPLPFLIVKSIGQPWEYWPHVPTIYGCYTLCFTKWKCRNTFFLFFQPNPFLPLVWNNGDYVTIYIITKCCCSINWNI